MSDEPKDQRIPIMMSTSEVEDIDDWAFSNRIRTRSEAVRRLCRIAILLDRLSESMFSTNNEIIDVFRQDEKDKLSKYIKGGFLHRNKIDKELFHKIGYLNGVLEVLKRETEKAKMTDDASALPD